MSEQDKYIQEEDSYSSSKESNNLTGKHLPLFNSFLPFDPFRYLYGIIRHWYFPISIGVALSIIGVIAGLFIFKPHYTISLQLIKLPVFKTIKVSEIGDPFKPRELNDETLKATLVASEVIQNSLKRIDSKRSIHEVFDMIDVGIIKESDFFYITYNSDVDAEDAISFIKAWAEEILEYTRKLQKQEAIEMAGFLKRGIANISRQLEATNNKILEFSQEHGFIDTEKEVDIILRSSTNAATILSNARIELESKKTQIEQYKKELSAQNPFSEQLRQAKEDLSILRGRYTDANSLVKEKLQKIDYLEQKLKEIESGKTENLEAYTGTPLGKNLYLQILDLEKEKVELENKVSEYTRMVEAQKDRTENIPMLTMKLNDLLVRREALQNSYNLMSNRLQEAELFSLSAPGYWAIFQLPSIDYVQSSKVKPILWGTLGAAFGILIGCLFSIFLEIIDSKQRTRLELCITTKAPILLELEKSFISSQIQAKNDTQISSSNYIVEPWKEDLLEFSLTHLVNFTDKHVLPIITFHTDEPAEVFFWATLGQLIKTEGRHLCILDTSLNRWALSEKTPFKEILSGTSKETLPLSYLHFENIPHDNWLEKITSLVSSHTVIVRSEGIPSADVTHLFERIGFWAIFSTLPKTKVNSLKKQLKVYREFMGHADGTILLWNTKKGILNRVFDRIYHITVEALRVKNPLVD